MYTILICFNFNFVYMYNTQAIRLLIMKFVFFFFKCGPLSTVEKLKKNWLTWLNMLLTPTL